MSSIFDWSLTAATNATADSLINWQEGQLPSTVNNSARQMMARVAELLKDLGGTITAGGTANALTVTANSQFAAYASGQMVAFKAAATNSGAVTLNVNAIGAKAVRTQIDAALLGGEISAPGIYICVYDASLNGGAGAWMLLNAYDQKTTKGHISGLALTNNASDATNDIDIAAGDAASDGAAAYLMTLASALTKRLDASWAVGSGNGGLDTGAVGNNVYYEWLIQRSDTGVVDALFSLSSSSPTMPTNYDRKRLIGGFARVGGVNTTPFLVATPTVNQNLPMISACAIASFTGSGSAVLTRGVNISSVVRNSTGNYTVNFSIAPPTGFVVAFASTTAQIGEISRTSTSLTFGTTDAVGTAADAARVSVTIM